MSVVDVVGELSNGLKHKAPTCAVGSHSINKGVGKFNIGFVLPGLSCDHPKDGMFVVPFFQDFKNRFPFHRCCHIFAE